MIASFASAEKKDVQQIFARQEKKYLLTKTQFEEFYGRLLTWMHEDVYGKSTVCSLYYDNAQNELIIKSIDKPRYKEKFRLRSYGVPGLDDPVFAEIKKKYDGVVYKRRVIAPYDQMNAFLAGDISLPDSPQIQKEIRYMIARYDLRPAVYLAYDRLALAGKDDPKVRVTFDFNPRFRTDRLDLAAGDDGIPLRDDDFYICETKLPGAAPLWLAQLLSELKLYPGTFSKYGVAYREHLYRRN